MSEFTKRRRSILAFITLQIQPTLAFRTWIWDAPWRMVKLAVRTMREPNMALNLPDLDVDVVTAATAENVTGPPCIVAAIFLFVVAETQN